MTAKDLKNALLQEAVQGKLVPQIASEGNARDLLEEIRKEKLSHGFDFANAKSGKRKPKKETALAGSNPCGISEEEIPFEIPESWCWCRLGEISTFNGGYAFKSGNYVTKENGVRVLRISDFDENGIKEKNPVYYPFNTEMENYKLSVNDIIMCMTGGTVGKSYLVKILNEEMYVNQRVADIKCPGLVDIDYIYSVILSHHIQASIQDNKNSTNDNISAELIRNFIIPLPPLAEQKRIVAAVEKFMPLIEEYGKKETELKALNEQIGTLTKKAILQEAVQGKLIPQIAAEGNAKDLLEEINKEKAKLIKEGKIKKDTTKAGASGRALPEITEDEIPFDIPESWCWCRLGEIVHLTSGQDLQPEMYNSSQKGIPYITGASNFNNGNVIINRWTETPKSVAIKDDLLLTCKGTVGEMAFLKEKKVHIARQVMSIRSSEKISLGYVKIYLTTQIENLKSKAKSMIPGIAREDVISSLIPLPPLSEQKRIVAAIEKMLPVCEKLGV